MLPLVCPISKCHLRLVARPEANDLLGDLTPRPGALFGETEAFLLRDDNVGAYPVQSGVPILLPPEMVGPRPMDLAVSDPRWAEAYAEMGFYNDETPRPDPAWARRLKDLRRFPFPSIQWLDAPYDAAAQWEAFRHIGDLRDAAMAQLGGIGLHAVKSLIAGASEAWLVTPIYKEALFGLELADMAGVGDRFHAVVAIGEGLPFGNYAFDVVYAGGCLHHMNTDFAGPEISRVLASGGRFASVDPWRTVLHSLGTKLVGKRERGVNCRPLDPARLQPLYEAFDRLEVRRHGPLLRYVALGLHQTMKREITIDSSLRLFRIDDALPLPRRMRGSIAILAARTEE